MKKYTIIIALINSLQFSYSQDIVKWSFTAKKISDKNYEIHLTPAVQNSWHIYSQTSQEGGALPTTISFNRNPLINIEGKTKEIGKIVSKYEDVFDVTVKYFEGKADFVQTVRLNTKVRTSITGSIEYMACNEQQCTSPQIVRFSIKLE